MPTALSERILAEDNHILVINKACGEIAQGDKTGDPSLLDDIKSFIKDRDSKPGNVFLGLVHRLDRPTSGVMVFAKTSKALARLNAAFHERSARKVYWAIVEGAPEVDRASLTHFLSRNEKQNKSYAFDTAAAGRQEARMDYKVLARGDRYSLLEIELHTGRHHQIRAQLAYEKLCIKGDLKYGAARSNPDGGICLHSRSLTIKHPVRDEELSFAADPRQVQSDKLWSILGALD